jgi:cold shock CspA family protein
METAVDKLATKLLNKLFNHMLTMSPLRGAGMSEGHALLRRPGAPSLMIHSPSVLPLHRQLPLAALSQGSTGAFHSSQLETSQPFAKVGSIWLPSVGHSIQASMFDKLLTGKVAAEGEAAGEDSSSDGKTKFVASASNCLDNGKRFHGFIKKFAVEKGFGFIDCDEFLDRFGRDIFLDEQHIGEFKVGDAVSFMVFEKRSGKMEAVSLSKDTHLTEDDRSEYQEGPVPGNGWVVYWNRDKGYGFVQPSDGSETIFCHCRELLDGIQPEQVNVADLVTFEKWYSKRRKQWHGFQVRLEMGDGVVTSRDNNGGFGIIEPKEGGGPGVYFKFPPVGGKRVDPNPEKFPWSIPEYQAPQDDNTGQEVTYVLQFDDLRRNWMYGGRIPARLYTEATLGERRLKSSA